MKKIKKWFKNCFFKVEDKKEVLHTKNLKILAASLFAIFTIAEIFWPKDSTSLSKSSKMLTQEKTSSNKGTKVSGKAGEVINQHQASFEEEQRELARRNKRKIPLVPKNVAFSAKQVITRSGLGGTRKPLPSGTNFIGQLLNGIDTRNENQTIKVSLPYGAKHQSGGTIPKEAILLGKVSYNGQGKKVFLSFYRIIFPNGAEYKIEAHGLSSYDYSPGLIGEYHGNADLRMAAQVGLTVISAASDVLTSRTQIGGLADQGVPITTPDATMENAALQGVSKVTKNEANNQAAQMNQEKAYVTVDAGSDLIISLLTPFNGEES